MIRFLKKHKLLSAGLTVFVISFAASLGTGLYERSGNAKERQTGSASRAQLNGPYTDWRQQEIPFGFRSFFLAPWRSYMDTWDASRYKNVLGIVFNVKPEEADASAQVLAEAGIRSARIEIGWDSVSYEDDTQMSSTRVRDLSTILHALRTHGIRPLILLNANSGSPAPSKHWKVNLVQDAPAGSREIFVENPEGIIPHYTGLTDQAYQVMYPVITSVDPATGRCLLSAPLKKGIKAGETGLIALKYRPLTGAVLAGGAANPSSEETLRGWEQYVATVTRFVKDTLGTAGKADAGFDLEVWNEYTFGSHFLDINNYYSPPLAFQSPVELTMGGRKVTGPEVLLPLTLQLVNDKANGLPGVRVISGFSNQRPWDHGGEMWEGQTGFSRHYYNEYNTETLALSPDNPGSTNRTPLNARGEPDGIPDTSDHFTARQGSFFVPSYNSAFPESWFSGEKIEYLVRDIQPFPSPWTPHYRYSNNEGQAAQVWMTETNMLRLQFAKELAGRARVQADNPQLAEVMHAIGAKATLRTYVFGGHKGLETIELYSAKGGDTDSGVLPDAFFRELALADYKLTARVRKHTGAQLSAVKNTTRLMAQGKSIATPRPLKVEKIVEYEPRLVFKGLGTAEHPDRYNRDDFAVLPYQLDEGKFAVGYYVVTRNVMQAWNTSKGELDTARYSMPDQTFALTLSNLAGSKAEVYSYDPIRNENKPVKILEAGNDFLTVEVLSSDYPRFLVINERQPGPVLIQPSLSKLATGGAVLRFGSNVDGEARISWGEYPNRSGGSFREEIYEDQAMRKLISSSTVSQIQHPGSSTEQKGYYKWSGQIAPQYSERYTFIIQSEDCSSVLKVGRQVVAECGPYGRMEGSVQLEAGKLYDVVLTSPFPKGTRSMALYWASDSQAREVVPPASKDSRERTIRVKKGEGVSLPLPDLKDGEGVKVLLMSGALVNQFPQWNYDTAGVIWNGGVQ
jgi:hypothetical protein